MCHSANVHCSFAWSNAKCEVKKVLQNVVSAFKKLTIKKRGKIFI